MEKKLSLTLAIACSVSALVIIGALIFAGCATADPPIVKDGCAVNLKHVCQSVVDDGLQHSGLISLGDGQQLDRQRLQNLSVRHLEVEVVFWQGSGTLLRCVVDTQNAQVTDAGIARGLQFNDADIEHLRQRGLCQ